MDLNDRFYSLLINITAEISEIIRKLTSFGSALFSHLLLTTPINTIDCRSVGSGFKSKKKKFGGGIL